MSGLNDIGIQFLPPFAAGKMTRLSPRSTAFVSSLRIGRPVFMSMPSAHVTFTNLCAVMSLPSVRSTT